MELKDKVNAEKAFTLSIMASPLAPLQKHKEIFL
jgi:hypothetical protein